MKKGRIGEFIETESRLEATGGMGSYFLKGTVSVRGDERVSEIDSGGACTECEK